MANAEEKKEMWNQIMAPDAMSKMREVGLMMNGFFNPDFEEICEPYIDMYYDALPKLKRTHGT